MDLDARCGITGGAVRRGQPQQQAGLVGGGAGSTGGGTGSNRGCPVPDGIVERQGALTLLGREDGVARRRLGLTGAAELVGELACMLRDRVAEHDLHRPANLGVEPGPPPRCEVVVQRVSNQAVAEPVATRLGLDHHPGHDGRLEVLEGIVGDESRGPMEDVERELAPDHGGDTQDGLHIFGKAPESPVDDVADHQRHGGGPALSLEAVLALQQPHELREEERVPVGTPVQLERDTLDRNLFDRRPAAHEFGDVGDGKAEQGKAIHVRPPGKVGQSSGQGRVAGWVRLVERAQHEHPCRRELDGEEAQQPQRRGVRPLEVVEHDHHGRRRGDVLDRSPDGLGEPEPSQLGVLGVSIVDAEQVGEGRLSDSGVVGQSEQDPDDLDPRPEGGESVVVVASPPCDAHVSSHRGDFLDQSRLTDPGLPADERDPSPARQCFVQCGSQDPQLAGTPDERAPVDPPAGVAATTGRHDRCRW